jgi:hypothetical protein
MHYFDTYGWWSESGSPDRVANAAPEYIPLDRTVGEPYPNYTGAGWVMVPYYEPPTNSQEQVKVPEDERVWWIDVGAFKDRFDAHGYPGLKLTILGLGRTSDVCYAVFADLLGRQYVDLKGRREELDTALNLIAGELLEAGKPPMTEAMRAAILTAPTTEAERVIKGLPDPV